VVAEVVRVGEQKVIVIIIIIIQVVMVMMREMTMRSVM